MTLPVKRSDQPLGPSVLAAELQRDGRFYKAAIKFALDVGEEGIKALVPGGGVLVKVAKGMLDIADAAGDAAPDKHIERLLAKSEEQIDAFGVLAQLFLLGQGEIIQRLDAREPVPSEHELDEVAHRTALVAYRSRIAQDYMYVDYRGIEGATRERHAAALLLDQVYVQPRLRSEREQQDAQGRETLLLRQLEDEDLTPSERARAQEEYAALTGKRWAAGRGATEPGLDIGDALGRARHAVILGGPGVGKSVLLRYLARTCALGADATQERLRWPDALVPVLIPLASFADARSTNPQLPLRGFLDQRMVERGGEALRQAAAAAIEAGDAIVLFDGIDEIPDPAARAAVVRAVERFLADHPRARCIVTSRPYGYFSLAGRIEHLTLGNFTDEQVSEFVHKWQRAFERWQHPDAPDLKAAEAEAKAMVEEIGEHEKVAELARNPLMLAVIALIRKERARLPEKRVQLYESAVRTLMDTWNRWRSEPRIDRGGVELPYEKLVQVWGRIAEWTRREKPAGVVHREALRRRLIEVLEQLEFDEDDPAATADSYLNAAVEKAGLLEERGQSIFAFWHPTFEEFLAAVDLARTPERLLPLRDDPRWREVILLAVGFIGVIRHDQQAATALLDRIAHEDPTPLEPLFRNHLRLAAACIADDVGARRSLGDHLVGELAERLPSFPYEPFTLSFISAIRALPRLRPSEGTFQSLSALADHPRTAVRMEAARLFANLATSRCDAQLLCTRLLRDSDSDVQLHAAVGLIRTGDRSWDVLSQLGNWSRADADARTRVLELLEKNPDLVRILVGWLGHHDAHWRAAPLLVESGKEQAKVIDALTDQLDAEDRWARLGAARLLVQLGEADDRVIRALVSVLDEDPSLRREAARLLIELDQVDHQMVGPLVSVLCADDPWVRLKAARLLVELGKTDEQVIGALVSVLGAEDPALRLEAARLLVELGKADEQVIGALVSVLGEASWLRGEAVQLLAALDKVDQQVLDALESVLGDDPWLSVYAARRLVELSNADQLAIRALVSGLDYEAASVRHQAAQPLGDLAATRTEVFEALVERVQPKAWRALAAWQKLLNQESLTEQDGLALAELVKIQDQDHHARRTTREALFGALWRVAQRHNLVG